MSVQRREPRWGLGDAAAGLAIGIVLSTIAAGIVLGLSDKDADELSLGVQALLQVPLWLGLAGSAVWAAATKGNGPVADFGFSVEGRDVPLGIAAGVATQLVVWLLYIPLFWLFGGDSDSVSREAEKLTDRAHGAGVALLVLIVVIGAPVVEELFYRGLVLRSLDRRLGTRWAIVISAAVFAVSHFQGIQLPALFVVGLVTGVLAVRTGRLGAGIVAHMTFNAITVALLL